MTNYTGAVPDTERATDWRDTAVCRGSNTDHWFPAAGNTIAVQAAKANCFACPAMLQCAQFALTTSQDEGVWGGLSEGQRTTIRKKYKLPQLRNLKTVEHAVYQVLDAELNPARTLRDLWDERTYPLPDGHLGWRGASQAFSFHGMPWTPKQLSFFLDRGHKAVGNVRRTCPVEECIHPQHLADNEERRQRQRAAAEATTTAQQAGTKLAPCGTRSAYQRHVRNQEPIDDACRAANTAACSEYTRSRSTKAASV